MARFHPLEVTDIKHTIRDAVVVTLKPSMARRQIRLHQANT